MVQDQNKLGFTTTTDSVGIIDRFHFKPKAFTVSTWSAQPFCTLQHAKHQHCNQWVVDISSQTGATKALSVIDGAIAMISKSDQKWVQLKTG